MNLSNELYISHSPLKEKKVIKSSTFSLEIDKWMVVYEDIEKILNGKTSRNMDLDIHLLLSKLI